MVVIAVYCVLEDMALGGLDVRVDESVLDVVWLDGMPGLAVGVFVSGCNEVLSLVTLILFT